jgi:hypothetical protein
MMNNARLSVGLEGLALSERAYQQAAAYARERRQGRALGTEAAAGESSPIVEHADVRRMLMTMRAHIEAMRGLLYYTAGCIDRAAGHPDADERARWDARTALLIPVCKAWSTDMGVELTSLGIQVHGGMGYVEETGAAQYLRDARIAPIYEGTNGIQAADLVFRKLSLEGGAVTKQLAADMGALADVLVDGGSGLADIGEALGDGARAFTEAASWLAAQLTAHPNDVAAGSTPFTRLAGIVIGGYFLARMAQVAHEQLAAGEGDPAFLADKIATARFYAHQILPQAAGLVPASTDGADLLYAIDADRL